MSAELTPSDLISSLDQKPESHEPESRRGAPAPPLAIARVQQLVDPALRSAVGMLTDERMRRIAGYQLGWWDVDGRATPGHAGKAIRPTLAVLAAEAACGEPERGVPVAVAVELVHNFSLLHDDIMDRDVERRHRPTGWVAFGESQALLAGNAMLVAAVETLARDERRGARTVTVLLDAVQRLISGQSADLALEQRNDVGLPDVLEMECGKTAALLSVSMTAGALAGGADDDAVEHLRRAGEAVGLAFQLIDDVLGVVGDPSATGKSASSDVLAGKRSAPIVAALGSGLRESNELAELLADGPPKSEQDVRRAVRLIETAGGLRWAKHEARRLLGEALAELAATELPNRPALDQIGDLARYIVNRDR
jgi:geranylgeranyl diphosphate synthase, type I